MSKIVKNFQFFDPCQSRDISQRILRGVGRMSEGRKEPLKKKEKRSSFAYETELNVSRKLGERTVTLLQGV